MIEHFSNSIDDTKQLGAAFAKHLKCGDTIVLSGDLGSGKTVFVSGFLSFYGKENEAASPTFTIVNEHDLDKNLKLFHFDVYRFDFEEEFTAIGGEEFYDKGICIIEWGEKIKNLLPKEYLEIIITRNETDIFSRRITFNPIGEKYENLVKEVLQKWKYLH